MAWGLAVAGYLVAAAWSVRVAGDRMNPDAVAYFQIARHWAGGRFDLAVNGWFSPGVSWLLVPAAWAGWNLLLTARVIGAGAGLVFAAGAATLAGGLGARRMRPAVFGIALLLMVPAVGAEITPDLLLACVLTWYLVFSTGLLRDASPRRAFAVGLFGGACFLVKTYALPFVVAHLCLTAIVRWRLGGGAALRSSAAALAGVMLAAGPWIAVISVHGGRLMINSGGISAQAWGPLPASGPLPVSRLHRPRDGRVTSWEDPVEIPYPWPQWVRRPGESSQSIRIRAAAGNARNLLAALVRIDGIGLLLAGTVVAGLLGVAVWRRAGDHAAGARVWGLTSLVIYAGGMLGLWVYDRFCWPLWGLMLAMFFSALDGLWRRPSGRVSRVSRVWPRAAAVLVAAVLAIGVAWRAPASLHGRWGALASARRGDQARRAAKMLSAAPRTPRPIAANRWRRGLFSAYWAQRAYLGELAASRPEDIAAELAPFGAATILIYDDVQLARAMGRSPHFELIDVSVDRDGGDAVGWLEYKPHGGETGNNGH